MTPNDRGPKSPSDRFEPYRELSPNQAGPTLLQTANVLMLAAIFLSVAPGLDVPADAIGGIAAIALVLYAVQILGGLYDLTTSAAGEVRA